MQKVAADQDRFLQFDPSKPAPQMILPSAAPAAGGKKRAGC